MSGDFTVCLFGWKTQRFAFDHACHTFLLGGLASGSRLSFSSVRKKKRLAEGCVSIPPWVGIDSVRSRGVVRLSDLLSSLLDYALLYGAPDGGTESAARRECVFAQTYWLCNLFRGEYAGAEMWKPHCGLSGLSSWGSRQSTFLHNTAIIAISKQPHPRPATPGYMERPVRL